MMIKAFKLTKLLLYLVLFPAYFVISIGLTILTDKVLLSFVIAIILLLVGIVVLEFYAKKKYADKYSTFAEECDPETYRDFLLEMLSKKLSNDIRIEVSLDLSYAYYHCGDFQQMKNLLDDIDFRQIKSKKKNIRVEGLKFKYYDMWLFYFMQLKDLESAEKVLNDIDNLYFSSDEVLKKMNESALEIKHLSFDANKDVIPDIEEKVAQKTKPDKMLYKVSDKIFLGKYYLRNGMNDKAKECLEFVVEHGNKLYMVKEAQSILKDLNKEN